LSSGGTNYSPNVWEALTQWLHSKKDYKPEYLAEPEPRAAIEETYRILSASLKDISVKQEVPAELTLALENNIFHFSGFKTHHELVEASQLLNDGNGNFKPFNQFLKDVAKIDNTYNRNYLNAEYNFAQTSSQMAVKWKEWEADGDDYDLQYRTAGDDRVREEHAALNGTTLPPSDPFWKSYLPPNGWNCRCTTVQVRKGKYPQSDSEKAMARGDAMTDTPKKKIFRFNPGAQEKIFPPKHPYYKAPEIVDTVITKIIQEKVEYKVVKTFKNGGTYSEHILIDKTKPDYKMVKNVGIEFARNGEHVKLLPKVHIKSSGYKNIYGALEGTKYFKKCPDLLINGKFYEVESFTPPISKKKLGNMLSRGLKQSNNIIINNNKGMNHRYIEKAIYHRVNNLKQNINEVWIYEKGKIFQIY
jgi:SPP1 gp7 family putative phage head morphogenesis protein